MNKSRRFLLIVTICFSLTPLFAFSSIDSVFYNQVVSRFENQVLRFPEEKLYLQTDKPYYNAGENVWFKGYLLNASLLVPSGLSRFIYVELIDKGDSVLSRVKIRKDSLGFNGYLHLKPEIAPGFYEIRAYTYWMQNASPDFFFHKRIFIGNSIDTKVNCDIHYGTILNGKIPVTLSFVNSSNQPIKDKEIHILQNWKAAGRKSLRFKTNDAGKVSWELAVDTTDHSQKMLNVSVEDPDLKFNRKIFLPHFSTDFDVQFFPESGNLLANNLQTVAFKAIGTDGLSVEISGEVFTSKNEPVTDLSSLNKGMGKFILQTNAGESYYAVVKSAAGITKRFELPALQPSGIAIHLVYNKKKIFYEISNHTDVADSTLYLLVHTRGQVFVIHPVGTGEGEIEENSLPAGINTFSVIDKAGNTYCERLYFVRNFMWPQLSMQSDKPVYNKREAVDLTFHVQSLTGKPVNGSYSVSVTDNRMVKPDTLSDNIQSNLLLTSDLKGYIEDPASYFVDGQMSTREKTDLLMLTQGWRRFNTADVVKGKIVPPAFYVEAGQALSGKVLNLFNKPVPKCDISMLMGYRHQFRLVTTNNGGNYMVDGIEFPDSTTIVLKARKKGAFGDVEIIPDQDVFPVAKEFIPADHDKSSVPPADYFQLSKQKYYSEGGMMTINLDEFTVSAKRNNTDDDTDDIYAGMADTQYKSDDLDKFPGMNIMNFLQTIPGVLVTGDNVSIRGGRDIPMFLVDGIEMDDIEDIKYLTTDEIQSISVFKGVDAAIFGMRGGNGVIDISLRKGVTLKTQTPISLATITPLGYQKPVEFYQPKYDVDSIRMSSKPDLRTTIYWNPSLKTDAAGNIQLHFFTADTADNYDVILEGVTNEGEICRYKGVLKRE